jgi:hypothetical protein
MATETVNQPCRRAENAGTRLPEFLTKERLELASAAYVEAAECTDAALHTLHGDLDEGQQIAAVRALLLRVGALLSVVFAAIEDDPIDLPDLQRRFAGEVL